MLDLPTPTAIEIPQTGYCAMQDAVQSAAPEEACGLLAGGFGASTYRVRLVIPTTNILHSAVRYRIAPQEQLNAFERIEAAGLELVGIYHSHPNGPAHPSATDLAEAYYPDAVYLIWSAENESWECAAFLLQNGQVTPVKMVIIV